MSDTVNVDTLERGALRALPEDSAEYSVLMARQCVSDLAARARDGQWCREVFEGDPRSFLEGYKDMEAEADRLARRVAELEADLQSIRLWWKRKPWEGNPDPGSFGGHPYSPNERALGYGTISDPRFLPPALAGDGGGA